MFVGVNFCDRLLVHGDFRMARSVMFPRQKKRLVLEGLKVTSHLVAQW